MDQRSKETTISQICGYLSPNLKQEIFKLLHSVYQNEEYLAKEIGCSVESLDKWKKDHSEIPEDKYMPSILSLALNKCSEVKNLLEQGLVKTVQRLCTELSVCGKDQEDEVWSKENIRLFMDVLDEKSRKIFWYFRWHGHVKLAELVNLINAYTDMEVLYMLKEVINPTAVRIFGRPILEFNESKIDHITGKKVIFNWWLLDFAADNESLIGKGGEYLVDIFDEDDQVVIVSEVSSSIRVSDRVKVEQRHGILSIRLGKIQ